MKKAVFIDKDGTLIQNIPYNVNTTRISLLPTVGPSLRRLKDAGYLLILVTNQAGVAYGYFKEAMLIHVFNRINQLLSEENVMIDGFYYCPHHPDARIGAYKKKCNCRKPGPGMLTDAAANYGIDLKGSWMIGDILDDVEAGNKCGCRSILVDNGNETEWLLDHWRQPTLIVSSFDEAASFILKNK
ncbi:D,D-heptose 1,7-bisphosphate phosphatase [Chitinophaga terrae (ex Kim and Jung 2007)]|uniref:D,D-heptose 1,7-bisphosphate phosphatase n=1 Tax=Chitinophaga terrae (ex Kim and Jung 2007) TaxID=408074 RepID=A0A1H4ELK3_9BACT|nr:HAD family hydrolase [Chitinophaga terrae (ex Kim and Jung 2007)]MDQ0107552.1 D,D-heptose 1,7-bisphosphate phosphatase [Chitinophaga terrae (ex Kim and Jung 2007)]GEP91705.1 D,D-heptose 1,7-bisphosphate phosphatase [Chitinophaga terrae (ex Kim and Jung 2007)]SEA85719.1 D,D-heptose 1,7-bisphosphate phosphatase [Chitinophaga terrae (ex Kim and Jung 2007)]